MEAFNRYSSQSYAPTAPPVPPEHQQHSSSSSGDLKPKPTSSSPSSGYVYSQPSAPPPPTSSSSSPYGYGAYPGVGGGCYFPPGTHPWIIQSFQAVDRDRSGSIDEIELQTALSSGYQKFSLRTIRLLMFLFKNPNNPSKIGPTEFAALWDCLGQWRAIFERFDRDRSGEIDSTELRDALFSLGYAVPDSVIRVLISKYNDGSGRRGALNFDSFVECGMIVKETSNQTDNIVPAIGLWVLFNNIPGGQDYGALSSEYKGLTEKFKEKDHRYSGSATLTYDAFMSMVIPFIVS